MLYPFYKFNVANNSVLELSTASGKNKVITGLSHPVLVLLVLNKLWVRHIIIPNLDKKIQISLYNQIFKT
jgi:hypothetical protein